MERKMLLLRLFVVTFLIGSCGLMTSCSDEDDEDVPPQPSEQNNEGKYTISGDRNREFSAEVMFQDTSDFSSYLMAYERHEVDQALIIESHAKAEEDSSKVTAFIARNGTSGNIGSGTYEVKSIDTTIESGVTVKAYLQGKHFTTQISTEKEGAIKINSREDNTLEGEFQDVKLQGRGSFMADTILRLNGSFTAGLE